MLARSFNFDDLNEARPFSGDIGARQSPLGSGVVGADAVGASEGAGAAGVSEGADAVGASEGAAVKTDSVVGGVAELMMESRTT